MSLPTTWHDAVVVEIDDDGWARVVPTFLGGGFRITVPPGAAALAHARAQALQVAEVLGTRLDDTAWLHLAAHEQDDAVNVVGGWPHAVGTGFGEESWTRLLPTSPRAVVGARVLDLPWTYASDSPTAGLPMISALEAEVAERHLREQRADVGLWWNARDELCTTTAGNVLVQYPDGTWLRPKASSGAVPTWAHDVEATRLGATPATLTRHVVGAGLLSVVTAWGDVRNLAG